MKKDKFFQRLEPWSERKHRLLGKYIKPFSAKVSLTTRNREIFCIDGFAGPAKYEDNKPGSPLMIAHLSDQCESWKDPVALKMINIEERSDLFASLENLTEKWVKEGKVKNFKTEFHKAVPKILSIIQQTPALFFIDPFGPTDIYFSYLLPILRRDQPITELILNFDTDGLQRIADTTRSKSNDSAFLKAVQTNIKNVSNILGGDEWFNRYKQPDLTPVQRQNLLLSIYLRGLRKFGYFVVAYPIREAINKPTKYHLIYCTRHKDGILLMNDFINEEENILEEEFLPLLTPTLNIEFARNRERLHSLIEKFLNENKITTRGKIKEKFIFEHFAQFHNKDYNAVVKDFVDSGMLRPSHGKKRINDNEPLTYMD